MKKMNTKSILHLILARPFLIGLMSLGLALTAGAQAVFQADLSTDGPGAQLNRGRIYFRAEGDQMDFLAVIYPFGLRLDELNPVLNVPGASLNFSLGAGTRVWLNGLHTVADWNPFLPAEPWLPFGYDEQGNPIYVDAPVIREADLYSGHFTLPDGFASDLLAGKGDIRMNSMLRGVLQVVAVPEPTLGAMLLLAGLWLALPETNRGLVTVKTVEQRRLPLSKRRWNLRRAQTAATRPVFPIRENLCSSADKETILPAAHIAWTGSNHSQKSGTGSSRH